MTTSEQRQPYGLGRFQDRVALVTGGTRGIGTAICYQLADGGASIAAGYWRHQESALNRSGHPVGDGIGLTVNAVTPGYTATDMLATIPDRVLGKFRSQISCGRLGKPAEVARVVASLAAGESSYITGQIWAVNGGLDM